MMFRLQIRKLLFVVATISLSTIAYINTLIATLKQHPDGKHSNHKARSTDELTLADIDMSYPDHLDRNFVDDSDTISLTVSRLSSKTMDWFQSNKSLKFNVSLVISHCDKSVGWIFDDFIPKNFTLKNVTIYTKCGNDVEGAPENTTIIKLPNIGRCDHTYAYHLNQLNTTALSKDHILLFLKDNNYQVATGGTNMTELLKTAYINGFSCLNAWHPKERPKIKVCPKFSSYFTTESLVKAIMPKAYSREEHRDKTAGFFSQYYNLGHWLESLNLTLPTPLTPVCFGGQFATTSSQIEKLKSKWGNIEKGLSRADNIEESHFTERMWAGLLSKRLSDVSTLKIISRLREVHIRDPIDQAGTMALYCLERPERRKRKYIDPNQQGQHDAANIKVNWGWGMKKEKHVSVKKHSGNWDTKIKQNSWAAREQKDPPAREQKDSPVNKQNNSPAKEQKDSYGNEQINSPAKEQKESSVNKQNNSPAKEQKDSPGNEQINLPAREQKDSPAKEQTDYYAKINK